MYSCRVDGRIQAEGEKNRTWVTGNIRYTEHKKYRMERAGQLDVKNVTRNALKKNNSALVEGVLPFDMENSSPLIWDTSPVFRRRSGTWRKSP